MTTATTSLTRGDWVILNLVDGDGEPRSDLHGQLARILDHNPITTTVRLVDAAVVTIQSHELRRAHIDDATGRTTGRWRVRAARGAIQGLWIAHAIPAEGSHERTPLAHPFLNWEHAMRFATHRAQRNIR